MSFNRVFHREAASRAKDVDLEMVHPNIDPGSTLATRLQVLRKPTFVPYMGAYGVPEDQVGWGKTGTKRLTGRLQYVLYWAVCSVGCCCCGALLWRSMKQT